MSILGTSETGNGDVEVASSMTPLDVIEERWERHRGRIMRRMWRWRRPASLGRIEKCQQVPGSGGFDRNVLMPSSTKHFDSSMGRAAWHEDSLVR